MAKFKVTLRSGEIKTIAFQESAAADFWNEKTAEDEVSLVNQFWFSHEHDKPWGEEVSIQDENSAEFVSIEKSVGQTAILKSAVVMTLEDEDGNVISNNFNAFESDVSFSFEDEYIVGNGVLAERTEEGVLGDFFIETDFFDFPNLTFAVFTYEGNEYVYGVMYDGNDIPRTENTQDTVGEGQGSLTARFV